MKNSHVTFIRKSGSPVTVEVTSLDPQLLATLLGEHNLQRKRAARCECTAGGLSISVKTIDATGHRFLAVFPRTGHMHNPLCVFHRVPIETTGLKGYTKGVVALDPVTGLHRIRLRTPLHARPGVKAVPAPSPTPAPGVGSPSVLQRRMTALGLLHFLWESAQLHIIRAGRSSLHWNAVAHQLSIAAKSVVIGQGTRTVADHLQVLTSRPISWNPITWLGAEPSTANTQRVVIIGMVNAFKTDPCLAISFVHQPRGLFLNLSSEQHELALKNERIGSQRLGLAIARHTGHDTERCLVRLQVEELATMPLVNPFVPVASSYEATIAAMLCDQGRVFRKPLRFDANSDAVLPDFELLDVGGRPYPMEVYGMATGDYEDRKRTKQAFYQANYGQNHWEWNAAAEEPIPPLPPPAL